MKQYLVLLKAKNKLDYSSDALEKRLNEYREWIDTIKDHYVFDNRLEQRGAHIKTKHDINTDGPFLEAKEIIAGFIILRANDLNQAIEITKGSPLLSYFDFFVRPIISTDGQKTKPL